MILSVLKVNDDPLESNRAVADFHLYGPKSAGIHADVVVIRRPINVSLSEVNPSSFVPVTTPLSA